jgi:hypothetical protein
MYSEINLPVYYQPENAYVKSGNNLSNAMISGINESWMNFKKSFSSGKLGLILLLVVLIFVSIVCWMNMVAYIKIANHEDDEQGISQDWAKFGAIANGIFALAALGFAIYLLFKIFKKETEEQKVEKQSRKFIGGVIDGARLYANKAVKESVSKIIIDPNDTDSAKSFIVTSTNAQIDNTLDRYKMSVLEGIIDQ